MRPDALVPGTHVPQTGRQVHTTELVVDEATGVPREIVMAGNSETDVNYQT